MRQQNNNLYTAEGAKALDRAVMKIDKLADGELMERAGEALYRLLRFRWPRARRITIICGPGNNGGDGYVLARKLYEAGLSPDVVFLGDMEKQPTDARQAREKYQQTGCGLLPYAGGLLAECDVIVDAILGIGTERDLTGKYEEVIEEINEHLSPVLAVDLPSGIHSNKGCILGVAVHAQATLCLIALKQGLLTGAAVEYVGELFIDDLSISLDARKTVAASGLRINETECRKYFPLRDLDTHKGEQGRLLVIGGAPGMAGAVSLTGEAGLCVGGGQATLAIHPDSDSGTHWTAELMVRRIGKLSALVDLLAASDVLIVGPGLGQTDWSRDMFMFVMDHKKSQTRLVLDADALNCLAEESVDGVIDLSGAVLTPHPGEAARLLGCSTIDVQADRYAAANKIAKIFNCVCVLKGAGTIVSDGANMYVCDRGHPALASAGTGDVLAGMIAGLLGQGCTGVEAAKIAVYMHALAGEQVAEEFGAGLKASDLFQPIARIVRRLSYV